MGIWHLRSKRKPTGGLLKLHRKKKKFEIGREQTKTTIGKKKLKRISARGKNLKLRLVSNDKANVYTMKTGKSTLSKVLDVIKNQANPEFVRRKVITKGSTIKTELGDAIVTSRPGQDGTINAVLIEHAETTKKKTTAKTQEKKPVKK